MPEKVLASDVAGIEAFNQNPAAALSQAENGAIAVFCDNAPLFYALTPARMAQLLALEQRAGRLPVVSTDMSQLNASLLSSHHLTTPAGKFAMFADWQPDADFQRMAALWGIHLTYPATASELSTFISYWQAEGKLFHHIQWQQKLARSIQISRNGSARRDPASPSLPDEHIPNGFTG